MVVGFVCHVIVTDSPETVSSHSITLRTSNIIIDRPSRSPRRLRRPSTRASLEESFQITRPWSGTSAVQASPQTSTSHGHIVRSHCNCFLFRSIGSTSTPPRSEVPTPRGDRKAPGVQASAPDYLLRQACENLYRRVAKQAVPIIKERKDLFRTYQKAFSGTDIISWLVEIGDFETRRDAVALLDSFLQLGLINCVSSDTGPFKDAVVFYRFKYDDAGHQLSIASTSSRNSVNDDTFDVCIRVNLARALTVCRFRMPSLMVQM